MKNSSKSFDVIIIGSGIIGASTAWQLLQKKTHLNVLILEKENQTGLHQTGRNSGVVHAGVYYEPGSLKAEFCKTGHKQILDFCKTYDLPYKQPGKLIVATNNHELTLLHSLINRCEANKIEFELVDQDKLKTIEKNVSGLKAIFIKHTAIVSYRKILDQLLLLYKNSGGQIHFNQCVQSISETDESIEISTERSTYHCRFLVSCSGLSSDRIARMLKKDLPVRIVPFRGEYYKLSAEKSSIVSHLIYPVADSRLPFLGVHLTPMISGEITVGPNAVLAFKREGYKKSAFNISDIFSMISFSGFWLVISRFFSVGLKEQWNSLFKTHYLKEVQKLCPTIEADDLECWPSGIRAQAVSKDGKLIHDFIIEETERSVLVCNAPSPGATSSLPIGNHISDMLLKKIN